MGVTHFVSNSTASPRHGWPAWLALAAVGLAALLVRGYSYWGRPYLAGTDYGQIVLQAQLYLDGGSLPHTVPYFQLGQTNWAPMPGAAMIMAVLSSLAGRPVMDVLPLVLILGLVEVGGVYMLAWSIFRRADAALMAASVAAVLPGQPEMMAWSGYPNLMGLAVMPVVWWAWLEYWQQPDRRRLILAALMLAGAAPIHHLTTLWIGATLGLFGVAYVVAQPWRSLQKLLPVGVAGLIIGLPVVWQIVDQYVSTGMFDAFAGQPNRFVSVRVNWEGWSRVVEPVSLVVLAAGFTGFLLMRGIRGDARLLMGAYTLVSVALGFGWLWGVEFYYTRALYFLALPIALGAAALLDRWRDGWLRIGVAAALVVVLGLSAILRARQAADYYQVLTPETMQAVEWLAEHSAPDDVVVVSTFLGFQMAHLLHRPLLVAMTPVLVGNVQEAPLAQDAVAVMLGLYNMDEVIDRRGVRFIMLKANFPDVPSPFRSQTVMEANPRLEQVFRNSQVVIYEVVDA